MSVLYVDIISRISVGKLASLMHICRISSTAISDYYFIVKIVPMHWPGGVVYVSAAEHCLSCPHDAPRHTMQTAWPRYVLSRVYKQTTPHLYSHRTSSFKHEGAKSLAQGDTPGTGSQLQTLNLRVVSRTCSTVSYTSSQKALTST
jgi:hypothetical protein